MLQPGAPQQGSVSVLVKGRGRLSRAWGPGVFVVSPCCRRRAWGAGRGKCGRELVSHQGHWPHCRNVL